MQQTVLNVTQITDTNEEQSPADLILSHSQLISDGRDVTPRTSVRKAVSYLDWTEQHLMYI